MVRQSLVVVGVVVETMVRPKDPEVVVVVEQEEVHQ
jgi:hypothetical protein|tara:strand:- start:111 stop:218 length:108 start_codon:yes stop_codon:yes gene_type:complete